MVLRPEWLYYSVNSLLDMSCIDSFAKHELPRFTLSLPRSRFRSGSRSLAPFSVSFSFFASFLFRKTYNSPKVVALAKAASKNGLFDVA